MSKSRAEDAAEWIKAITETLEAEQIPKNNEAMKELQKISKTTLQNSRKRQKMQAKSPGQTKELRSLPKRAWKKIYTRFDKPVTKSDIMEEDESDTESESSKRATTAYVRNAISGETIDKIWCGYDTEKEPLTFGRVKDYIFDWAVRTKKDPSHGYAPCDQWLFANSKYLSHVVLRNETQVSMVFGNKKFIDVRLLRVWDTTTGCTREEEQRKEANRLAKMAIWRYNELTNPCVTIHELFETSILPVYNQEAIAKAERELETAKYKVRAIESKRRAVTIQNDNTQTSTMEMIRDLNLMLAKAYEEEDTAYIRLLEAEEDAELEGKAVVNEAAFAAERAMNKADQAAIAAQQAASEESKEADIAQAAGLAHYRRSKPRPHKLWRGKNYWNIGENGQILPISDRN